ncbi:MAG: TIGR01906 family membrane protein [Nanoarchaeota archaeon]|nr:TIGR01906 family membrane protein [Nanoarchaeota archaeon]
MKFNRKMLIIIFCIFAVLMYLSSSVRITAFDSNMYKAFFTAKNIYADLPDADERAGNILDYLNGKEALNTTFFNEKEAAHMKDVRALFAFSLATLLISMLVLLAIAVFAFMKKDIDLLWKCALFGGISGVLFAVLLFLLSLNFSSFFASFHKVLFTNSLWLMNPLTDKIIALLPESFFRMAAKRIFLTFGVLSFGMMAAGIIIRWMGKRMKNV